MGKTIIGTYPTTPAVQYNAPQVHYATYATYDGQEQRRPDYERSFISFSYGGKYIEDFGLIATFENNWFERDASAGFEDLTSSYDILDGETYHGTHFKPLELSFTLSTDGMTQKDLEQFKAWFRGGITRTLVLSEHPNRFIYARLAAPPTLHMIPFKHMQTGYSPLAQNIETFTTLYKGTINITFISSNPFWQALDHILGSWSKNGGTYTFEPRWRSYNIINSSGNYYNANNELWQQQQLAKIIYEDNIPIPKFAASIRMGFGETGRAQSYYNHAFTSPTFDLNSGSNNASSNSSISTNNGVGAISTSFRNIEPSLIITEEFHRPLSLIFDGENARYDTMIAEEIESITSGANGEFMYDGKYYRGARIMGTTTVEVIDNYEVRGYIAGSNIVDAYDYPQTLEPNTDISVDDLDSDDDDEVSIALNINNRGLTNSVERGLIKSGSKDETPNQFYFFYGGTAPSPATISFTVPITFNDKNYIDSIGNSYLKGYKESYIEIKGIYTKKVGMTTPNIMSSYNKAINIFRQNYLKAPISIVELYDQIRDGVRHPAVRAHALRCIEFEKQYPDDFTHVHSQIVRDQFTTDRLALQPGCHPRLQELMKDFWLRLSAEIEINSSKSKAIGKFSYRTNTVWQLNNGDTSIESYTPQDYMVEDIGDAMLTTWYYIEDRNEFKVENGDITISAWTNDHPEYSHKVISYFPVTLNNFWISYEYMYL